MNARLLAVVCALAASTCAAQTADPVTLYGRVYVTVESVEARGAPEVPDRMRVSDNSSMIGVRGSEALGGGTSAFFQLETQFRPDENTTTFANRNSGVGLRNAFGSVLLGRWDTPYKWVNDDVDVFDDFTIAAYSMVLQGSGIANVDGQFNRRDQNVVQYWSPKLAGFELRLSYSANEGKSATLDPKSEGASLTWAGGPFEFGASYHELRDQPFGIYTNAALGTGSVTLGKQTGASIHGIARFGALRLGAAYQEFRRKDPVLPAVIGPSTVVGFDRQQALLANAMWSFGAHHLMYQYGETRDGGQRNADAALTPASPRCRVHAAGYRYDFTRRTFLIAEYVRVDNNATATCTLGQNGLAIAAGQDPRGASIGLRHAF
jgi:predicted porin